MEPYSHGHILIVDDIPYILELLKAHGDEFSAFSGMTGFTGNPVLDRIKCGFEMIETARLTSAQWEVRVGKHIGPAVGGVVGRREFLYGIWGDTVNVASRAQSHGIVAGVNMTRAAWDKVGNLCDCESRGEMEVKCKGYMEMFRINKVFKKEKRKENGRAIVGITECWVD